MDLPHGSNSLDRRSIKEHGRFCSMDQIVLIYAVSRNVGGSAPWIKPGLDICRVKERGRLCSMEQTGPDVCRVKKRGRLSSVDQTAPDVCRVKERGRITRSLGNTEWRDFVTLALDAGTSLCHVHASRM